MPNVILCDKVYLLIVLFAYLMHLLAVRPAFQVNTQEKGMGLPDISVGIPYLPDNIRFGYASADHQLRWSILSETAAEGFRETGE